VQGINALQTPNQFLMHELTHDVAVRQRIVVLPFATHGWLIARRAEPPASGSGAGSRHTMDATRQKAIATLTLHAQRAPCVEIASVPPALLSAAFEAVNASVFFPRLSRDDVELLNLFSTRALAFLHRHRILVGLQAGTLMGALRHGELTPWVRSTNESREACSL
jgi:hypothetical protein